MNKYRMEVTWVSLKKNTCERVQNNSLLKRMWPWNAKANIILGCINRSIVSKYNIIPLFYSFWVRHCWGYSVHFRALCVKKASKKLEYFLRKASEEGREDKKRSPLKMCWVCVTLRKDNGEEVSESPSNIQEVCHTSEGQDLFSLSSWSAGHKIMDFRFYLKSRKDFLRGRSVSQWNQLSREAMCSFSLEVFMGKPDSHLSRMLEFRFLPSAEV